LPGGGAQKVGGVLSYKNFISPAGFFKALFSSSSFVGFLHPLFWLGIHHSPVSVINR
jgi:hypothetical protein